MPEDISFHEEPKKEIVNIMNDESKKIKDDVIKKLEKTQIEKQVRAEAGITEIPKEPESIPKELPKLIFKMGSKIISCPNLNLDEEESKVMAKHLSILVGAVSSKWYSAIIVVIITISKISECIGGIKKMFPGNKKKEEIEMKNQGRPIPQEPEGKVFGDGT